MKIKANNANSPIWKDVYSHSMLPEALQPLHEMATNLWWVWNHEGAKLFGKSTKTFGYLRKVTRCFYSKAYHSNVLKKSRSTKY